MSWLSKGLWKAVFVLAGTLLFVVLLTWIHISSAEAHEPSQDVREHSVAGGTMIAPLTPTEDATVTALNKEKLVQDIGQQQHTWGNWFWNNGAALISSLALAIAGAFTLFRYLRDQRIEREKKREDLKAEQERRDEEQQRWLKDQQAEREKRAEERFQAVVEGLSSEREEARIGAAITLRNFLHQGYEQFYRQAFDLAITYLHFSTDSSAKGGLNTLAPLNSLRQALIIVFKESFPLTRGKWEEQKFQEKWEEQKSRSDYSDYDRLGAVGIQLDNAYLVKADLRGIWMREAFLRYAHLYRADFTGAHLKGVDFTRAYLEEARLRRANSSRANFTEAALLRADFTEANISRADFTNADLTNANLRGTYPETTISLKNTRMNGVTGLTQKQLEACKAKGAIIDEDMTTSSSQFSAPTLG
jgi:uncharacterized protein YjbI with pentapeptide repeats